MSSNPPTMDQVISRMRTWTQRARPTVHAQIVTVPFIVGSGTTVLSTGVLATLPIFFRSRLVGIQIQEFDGNSGSLTLDVGKFTGGPSPVITSLITPSNGTVPTITSGRFYSDKILHGWNTKVSDGDYLVINLLTVTSFQRLSIALRLRRNFPTQ